MLLLSFEWEVVPRWKTRLRGNSVVHMEAILRDPDVIKDEDTAEIPLKSLLVPGPESYQYLRGAWAIFRYCFLCT